MNKSSKIFVSFLLLLVLLVGEILFSTRFDPARTKGEIIDKINSYEGIIFVTQGDPESAQQLNEFSPYTRLLNVIDCSQQVELCTEQKIEDLPSILLRTIGIELVGFQSLEDLTTLFNQIEI